MQALSSVGGNQFAPMVQTVAELRRLRTRLQRSEEELAQKTQKMEEMEKGQKYVKKTKTPSRSISGKGGGDHTASRSFVFLTRTPICGELNFWGRLSFFV